MWARFAEILRCAQCRGRLELEALLVREAALDPALLEQGERLGISPSRLAAACEAGLLVCSSCRLWYPILHDLPILLPYRTPIHDEFIARYGEAVSKLGPGFDTLNEKPVTGEAFVQRSFSQEWLDYSYDGVLWSWSYEDRDALFLAEIGLDPRPPVPARFLEIGCGIGLVTSFAARHFPGDAVGLDLSLAALRAARHFRDRPFIHFVQASLWKAPFLEETFDLLYSHGVLHHTFSTEEAFRAVAPLCKIGGRTYIWVYGNAGTRETLSRRVAYAAERLVRPVLARMPTSAARLAIAPFALLYIGINWAQRNVLGRHTEHYNYERAQHAARDRLTPLFAFRHSAEEVQRWFREAGFTDVHVLRESEVDPPSHDSIRRNVAVRGRRTRRDALHRPS